MSPSYRTIEEYQRLVKNVINQNLKILLPNRKHELIKYEVIFWKMGKAKIAYFRRHFSDRSKQVVSRKGHS